MAAYAQLLCNLLLCTTLFAALRFAHPRPQPLSSHLILFVFLGECAFPKILNKAISTKLNHLNIDKSIRAPDDFCRLTKSIDKSTKPL